jgi:hypothetical protein
MQGVLLVVISADLFVVLILVTVTVVLIAVLARAAVLEVITCCDNYSLCLDAFLSLSVDRLLP